MPDPLRISRVRFTPAPLAHAHRSLVGFASCSIAELGRLDGLAVRRTGPAIYAVTFPARKDQAGRRHPFFRPKNRATREAIERGVIEALRARGVLP